jgi:hypothetical protein
MRVAADGQSWLAWRRTISGWCFAIGSTGPPINEWLYDGAEPPMGFPGGDPEWDCAEERGDRCRNWDDDD